MGGAWCTTSVIDNPLADGVSFVARRAARDGYSVRRRGGGCGDGGDWSEGAMGRAEGPVDDPGWTLDAAEREVLAAALDALLPPAGSFPPPSRTDLIDAFIVRRVPPAGVSPVPYPGLDADGLRAILTRLAPPGEMTAKLAAFERDEPRAFLALWRLAVYGYYSRRETIAAIGHDLAPAYHGAPQPLGYAHAIAPWDPDDPLQRPRHGRGAFSPTAAVRRVELAGLPEWEDRG
jgi:hypothetical protein